jgi:transcriptional regulator with XRE-family HTH domain
MSVVELARRSGLARSTITRWEHNQAHPNSRELSRALSALEMPHGEQAELFELIPSVRALQWVASLEGASKIGQAHDLLRAMRLRTGQSQEELARQIGVSKRAVIKWEQGESWPSPDNLHHLCFALRARVEELAALTAGPSLLPDSTELFDEFEAGLSRGCRDALLRDGALLDLRAVSLQYEWRKRHRHSGLHRGLLYEIRSTYAQGLRYFGRNAEAAAICLEMQNQPVDREVMVPVLRAQIVLVQTPTAAPARRRRHIERLRSLSDDVQRSFGAHLDTYRVWAISAAAAALGDLGNKSACLAGFAQAHGEHHPELGHRGELDQWHARYLNRFGQFEDALALTDHALAVPDIDQLSRDGQLLLRLENARARYGLGQITAAVIEFAAIDRCDALRPNVRVGQQLAKLRQHPLLRPALPSTSLQAAF